MRHGIGDGDTQGGVDVIHKTGHAVTGSKDGLNHKKIRKEEKKHGNRKNREIGNDASCPSTNDFGPRKSIAQKNKGSGDEGDYHTDKSFDEFEKEFAVGNQNCNYDNNTD